MLSRSTYIFPDNGTETGEPEQAGTAHLVHVQALAAENGLAETLALVILDDALCGRQVRVLSDRPRLFARQAQTGDVAEHGRGQEKLAGPDVGGTCELGAGDELLHAELDLALERDRVRHGHHDARLRLQRTAHGQLDGEDGVAVPVTDTVTPAVEGADVVDGRRGSNEVCRGRRAPNEVGRIARVDRRLLDIVLLWQVRALGRTVEIGGRSSELRLRIRGL